MSALLKTLVIGMGVLIVLGMGGVAYGIYANMQRLQESASGDGWGEVVVELPAGARVTDMEAADDMLYLHHQRAGTGGDGVVVVDTQRGRVVGRLRFEAATE
ncbi:hypothetical protein [Roseospirillum parvum]|uniref:Uncharacterized protein n=1 Tax=Roseospirillum parvum TaxID=83401 RepID=A0A1G7Y6Y5_9PROT|nr:hypothetical protein [Roseospirillum parvum]SDG92201.1 hypothetical protein SAMN05421742_103208 [Roseospirillum parvum]